MPETFFVIEVFSFEYSPHLILQDSRGEHLLLSKKALLQSIMTLLKKYSLNWKERRKERYFLF